MTLSLSQARAIIAGTLAAGSAAQFKPLTVVVLDAGGHVLAVEREDGSSNKRFEVAHGKAHGAVSMGMGSRALMERAEQQPYFVAGVTQSVGALVPVPGGVLVQGRGRDPARRGRCLGRHVRPRRGGRAGRRRVGRAGGSGGLTCRSSTWSSWARRW